MGQASGAQRLNRRLADAAPVRHRQCGGNAARIPRQDCADPLRDMFAHAPQPVLEGLDDTSCCRVLIKNRRLLLRSTVEVAMRADAIDESAEREIIAARDHRP